MALSGLAHKFLTFKQDVLARTHHAKLSFSNKQWTDICCCVCSQLTMCALPTIHGNIFKANAVCLVLVSWGSPCMYGITAHARFLSSGVLGFLLHSNSFVMLHCIKFWLAAAIFQSLGNQPNLDMSSLYSHAFPCCCNLRTVFWSSGVLESGRLL